jgi:hypothetical protein
LGIDFVAGGGNFNMFKIKIDYETGDSFSTYCDSTYLEGSFEKIETVKENIQRIKNHCEFYKKYSNIWEKPNEDLPKGVVWEEEHRCIVLETIDDEGNKFVEWPEWTGHFETLLEVSVVTNLGWKPV